MPGLGGTTNNYEILAQLASGGMAEIFLARVTAVGGVERHVVLKRILPALRDDAEFVTMFLDEARLQAQLHHPNIAQLHDVGRLGSSYFYTMEYVHGETVQSLMQKAADRREPIPLQHVLAIAAGVTAALHHAHTRTGTDRKPLGIVHRDVSPANIMITFDGAVKLLDFGVAKSKGRRMMETQAGIVKGKVAYLTPEQIGGKPLDGRCDLFSLGICLYELLTLHALFTRDTDLSTLAAIVQEQVPPPSYFRKDVPPEIDALVMTALAKDRDTRYPHADAMHQAVETAATRTKLSMSPSSLGRYLTKLFGERVEPWLEEEGLAPVTVTGDIIEPTQGVPPIDPAKVLAAERLDVKIKKVRPITLRKADRHELDTELEDDPFAESVTTEARSLRPRATLPMAAAHPLWEATVMRAPLPPGLDLEKSRHALEDFGSQLATPVAPVPTVKPPSAIPPSGPRGALPAPPSSVESMRPVAMPRPATPAAASWNAPPGTQAGWMPPTARRPPPPTNTPPPTSWNIPRLIMAVAVLVAIVVGIWLAVT